MIRDLSKEYKLLLLSLLLFFTATPTHSTSRYFLFLEPPELYVSQRPYTLKTDLFYISLSNGFDREESSTSLIGLYGEYNVRDTINAFLVLEENKNLLERSNKFKLFDHLSVTLDTPGKVRAQGFSLTGQCAFSWIEGLSCGFWLPVMHVSTRSSYEADPAVWSNIFKYVTDVKEGKTIIDTIYRADSLRRDLHDKLGLQRNFWSKTGFGDLDCYLQYNKKFSYILRMRSLTVACRLGMLIPTGIERDYDYPSSVPFMGDGHWAAYTDFALESELKQDLKVGALLCFSFPFSKTKTVRLPLEFENPLFSPFKVQAKESIGITMKISPYIILEHLTQGLHFEARYTYLRHSHDHYSEYSGQQSGISLAPSKNFVQDYHERLSSWRDHTFTFRLKYDTQSAGNKFMGTPVFSLSYDRPIGGRGVAKMNQVTLGADWHF